NPRGSSRRLHVEAPRAATALPCRRAPTSDPSAWIWSAAALKPRCPLRRLHVVGAGWALFFPRQGRPPGRGAQGGGPPDGFSSRELRAHRLRLGLRKRLLQRSANHLVLLEQAAEVAAVDAGGAGRAGHVVPALLQQRREVAALEGPHRQPFGLGVG